MENVFKVLIDLVMRLSNLSRKSALPHKPTKLAASLKGISRNTSYRHV